MDERDLEKVTEFVRPLYLDLDGASGMEGVERVSALARSLHTPATDDERFRFELLLRFQGLRKWLERVGNFSRTTLTLRAVVDEELLGETLRSLRRIEAPVSPAERALAAATWIDEGGVMGLAHRFSRARREGSSIRQVALDTISEEHDIPDWMTDRAREILAERRDRAVRMCRELLAEMEAG